MKTDPNAAINSIVIKSGYYKGLTKREYFAAMAMQGILSANTKEVGVGRYENVAHNAIRHADALIEALNK